MIALSSEVKKTFIPGHFVGHVVLPAEDDLDAVADELAAEQRVHRVQVPVHLGLVGAARSSDHLLL